jgi:iron complex outermembrane recepter protein
VNSRRILQTVTSAYVQADTRVTRKLQILGGVRFENTLNEFNEFNPRLADEVIAAGYPFNRATGRATTIEGLEYQYRSRPRVTRESEYHNWFPSISAKYKILSNFDWHAGWNKSISRPPIDNLTGLWTIFEEATPQPRVDAPNANLQPENSQKLQTRLAYYFGNRMPGELSVSLQQVKVRNFRRTFDLSPAEFGVTDPEFSDYVFRTTINDTDQVRRFRNMDITYRQTLGFLPELFRGTSVSVNYTRSYANVRRARQAPHRVTTRLGYNYRRFNGSLGMMWRDDTPWDSRYGYYQRHITQFDLSATYKLTRRASLYVQARNFTGKPVQWFDTPTGLIEKRDSFLRSIQEYGSNWVFGVKGTF